MSTATVVKSKHKFRMHPAMLMDIIKRQAGTLVKAILEGAMNAVDAGATRLRIELTSGKLVMSDNGRGITDRVQIERNWGVFGQPQSEFEKSQKTYGRFRMGRGQLFSYGVNNWRTGTFSMQVDVNSPKADDDDGYELTEGLPVVEGCTIEIDLYVPLLPSDKAKVERELAEVLKYTPCEVTFNGEQISTPPAGVKWDGETDEAYYKLRDTSSLHVYNLGVLVRTLPGHEFGTGGEVVSKQELKVNFARNEIMSDCPVWKAIKPVIDKRAKAKNAKAATLTDDARQRLADQMKAGELDIMEALGAKVFTDVNGRHWSISQLNAHGYNYKLTVTKQGDRQGKALFAHKLAFVLSRLTMERFGVKTLDQLISIMDSNGSTRTGFKSIDFAKVSEGLDSHFTMVEEKHYTATEKVVLAVMGRAVWLLQSQNNTVAVPQRQRRKLLIGLSETASSWTDGETYIAFSRKLIATYGCKLSAWVIYCQQILSNFEVKYNNHSETENTPEYYESLCDFSEEFLPAMVELCIDQMPRSVATVGNKMNKQQLRAADKAEKVKQASDLLDKMSKPSDN
ncbi:MAG: hypothetical protein B7Z37_25015 [Verrucomicrobia bacterium 12-59-8]|nr:MAG: hypothetical protein B7Z37_25015 [Verrucomicrobia bacterium 12-59-8]